MTDLYFENRYRRCANGELLDCLLLALVFLVGVAEGWALAVLL